LAGIRSVFVGQRLVIAPAGDLSEGEVFLNFVLVVDARLPSWEERRLLNAFILP